MTAAIHTFPSPDWFTAEQRTDAIVAAARDILAHQDWHSDEVIHEACVELDTWGNGLDRLKAEQAEFDMELRRRRAAHTAAHVAAKRRPSLASLAVVAGALGFVLVAWVVLSVVLGVPSWI